MNGMKTCLLVEDDPDDQECFIEALHTVSAHAGCFAVSSGEEALLILREEGLNPDYIFTDIQMPGMNGYEFIGLLNQNKQLRNIPVVVYSSQNDELHFRRMKELGVEACYRKSHFDALCTILSRYFAEPASLQRARFS